MRRILVACQLAALLCVASRALGATEHVGIVKSLSGDVTVAREGSVMKAGPNLKLFQGDLVQTGPNGKAGLILEDDTVISLGSNSRLAIKEFAFKPNEKKLSLVARIYQGTVSFLSGQIAKLAPRQVHIETPSATVGVRGTHVLVRVD